MAKQKKVERRSVQFPMNKRLATTLGHVIHFEPGVPKSVPKPVYDEAIKQGGIPGNQKLTIETPDDEGGQDGTEGADNDSGVLAVARACRDIIDEADASKLTGENVPKVGALSEAVGFEVNVDLRTEAMKLVEEGVV